jgi:tripartite-type tricarboxylate transporter receptor subunit TctC
MPAELFRRQANLDVLYIPYKGENEALIDMVKGEVQAGFFYPSGVLPQVKAGKLRALAVAGRDRNRGLPDVPTMAQAGFPDSEFTATTYLFAPAGVPENIALLLNKEIAAILQDPEIRTSYESVGAEAVYGTLEEVRAAYARQHEQSVSLVKALNIKPQ